MESDAKGDGADSLSLGMKVFLSLLLIPLVVIACVYGCRAIERHHAVLDASDRALLMLLTLSMWSVRLTVNGGKCTCSCECRMPIDSSSNVKRIYLPSSMKPESETAP